MLPVDLGSGYVIREPDPQSRNPFGRVVAVVQIFVWPLVRPHSCPEFMRYRPGLSPVKHVEAREGARRWKRDALMTLGGVVLGAFLGAFLQWWLGG